MIGLLLALVALAGPVEDGDAAFEAGEHPKAIVSWTDALAQARARSDRAEEREILLRLASAQRELGAVGLAERVLVEAQGLVEQPADDAQVKLARGRLALHAGDLKSAEAYTRKAFAIAQKASAPEVAANAALNLGVVRLHQGRASEARKAFVAAQTLFSALQDDRGQADALVNLALLDRRSGDLRAARDQLERALGVYERAGDVDGAIDARLNLATIASGLARPEAGRRHLEAALSKARARKDLGRQAAVLHQLAGLVAVTDPARADTLLAQVEAAYDEVGRPRDAVSVAIDRLWVAPPEAVEAVVERAGALGDPVVLARAQVAVAQVLLERGDGRKGSALAKKALVVASRLELEEVRWQALYVVGAQARVDGDLEAATASLEEAVDRLDRRRRLLQRDDAAAFVAAHEPVYRALADAHLARGQTLAALATAERMSLSDLPTHEAARPAQELAERESWLQSSIADEVVRNGDSERAKALRKELAQLRVAFADTVDRLRTDVQDFDARVRVAPEDLEALQGELPAGVVVLQPILLPDRVVLLVFGRDHLQAIPVEVSPGEVEATLSKLTRALRAGLRQRTVLDPLAERLGAWLWAPAAGVLADADVVVVATAGPLRQLPFSLLRHDGRYLVEQSAVATITHVGSLRTSASPLRVEGRSLLLVGNPDGTLPGAEAEVRGLASRFDGSALLVGEAATRDAVLSGLGDRTTVHLATHGRIDPVEPSHSYLVLAPEGGSREESRLGYREIPGLAPFLGGARLVVLSACESGRPVDARGGEGVVSIQGLAAQFRRAGVETLVASLWKVDDAGTRALMEAFYTELAEGHDAATALAEAQRALIADEALGSPWVWAAFVVAGDWR